MIPALKIQPLKTSIFEIGENLFEFVLREADPALFQENVILTITSKLFSLEEKRLVPRAGVDKLELIKRESEHYLGEMGYGCHLTIKQGQLLATAGIDESNSEQGDYILYPTEIFARAEKLRCQIKEKFTLKNFGVLITDSHSQPLRHGVLGSCVAYAGFKPVRDRVGEKDLFGRMLKMTKQNQADALAAAAVLMMGEAAESCPLAMVHGAPVEFLDKTATPTDLIVEPEKDMYFPVYESLMKRERNS